MSIQLQTFCRKLGHFGRSSGRLGVFLLCVPFFLIYLGLALLKNAYRGPRSGETR